MGLEEDVGGVGEVPEELLGAAVALVLGEAGARKLPERIAADRDGADGKLRVGVGADRVAEAEGGLAEAGGVEDERGDLRERRVHLRAVLFLVQCGHGSGDGSEEAGRVRTSSGVFCWPKRGSARTTSGKRWRTAARSRSRSASGSGSVVGSAMRKE